MLSNKFISLLFLIIIASLEIKIQKHKNDKQNIYKELLELYIDNREKFYLKGREYIMKQQNKNFNISNVLTIQDKLNYLLVHESPENKSEIVDKILLRNYSTKIIGRDLCVPILKIYNNVDEINLSELPDKFVLKCNHGSGMNIVCKNKEKFNLEEAKNKLKKWMNINYGLASFEYQYINIKRKINCFNGEPKLIRIKRHVDGVNVNI